MASASMAILINLLHVYRYMLSLNPINDPFVVVHLPARDSVGRSVGSVRFGYPAVRASSARAQSPIEFSTAPNPLGGHTRTSARPRIIWSGTAP
jgi:hypothetical protein